MVQVSGAQLIMSRKKPQPQPQPQPQPEPQPEAQPPPSPTPRRPGRPRSSRPLTNRQEVLFGDADVERLKRQAQRAYCSVATYIRRAAMRQVEQDEKDDPQLQERTLSPEPPRPPTRPRAPGR